MAGSAPDRVGVELALVRFDRGTEPLGAALSDSRPGSRAGSGTAPLASSVLRHDNGGMATGPGCAGPASGCSRP